MCGLRNRLAIIGRYVAVALLCGVFIAAMSSTGFSQTASTASTSSTSSTASTASTSGTTSSTAGTGGGTAVIGFGFSNRAVGGISIDANGIVTNVEVDKLTRRIRDARALALRNLPEDLNQASELRKVSLRGLEAAIAEHLKTRKPISDDIFCLAGLQEIRYVFLDPEHNDIILAGFGEGWRSDPFGNLVGVSTGKPVLLLDDLLVALRTADAAAKTGITCSIDPTQAGIDRLQAFLRQGNPMSESTIAGIEENLGPQMVTVTGIPTTTHFAQVLVAADYRMKRLAMNFEVAPVHGLPSYLQMTKGSGSMMPRWWLEPDFDPLARDADGMAWEIPAGRIKAVTEDDFLAANGQREHSGKASPIAQRWADNMTRHYEELAQQLPIFAELKNVIQMAVVAALINKENLADKANCQLPVLLNPSPLEVAQFASPKQIPSKASFLKKGDNWVISASGGVMINSWAIAANSRVDAKPDLDAVRDRATNARASRWWWN